MLLHFQHYSTCIFPNVQPSLCQSPHEDAFPGCSSDVSSSPGASIQSSPSATPSVVMSPLPRNLSLDNEGADVCIQRDAIDAKRKKLQRSRKEHENDLTLPFLVLTPEEVKRYRYLLLLQVISWLESDEMNWFKCNVGIDTLQQRLERTAVDRWWLPPLIGSHPHRWLDFLNGHPSVFHTSRGSNRKWMVRLQCHKNWQQGEYWKRASQYEREDHWISCLFHFLVVVHRQPRLSCTVNEFIAAYPSLMLNQLNYANVTAFSLPPAGNLVRVIQKRNELFDIKKSNRLIKKAVNGEEIDDHIVTLLQFGNTKPRK